MRLNNVYIIAENRQADILIKEDRIEAVVTCNDNLITDNNEIQFNNAIAFPGLFNSHDHLDFNLFPQLGNKMYSDYVEWGDDIHQQNKDVIDKVLKVPQNLRINWGIYKNLINGVTTVINHGSELPVESDLITVRQEPKGHALHSVQVERNWRLKLNSPTAKKRPYVIHTGEGTESSSRKEIDKLLGWNLFGKELIGVHAIAMSEEQAAEFKAIIWCPDSNYFLMGQTSRIDKLKRRTSILFGSDSTVSARWNLWEHLRLARQEKMVTDTELFEMLTSTPAKIWSMESSGVIKANYIADITIAKQKEGTSGMDALFASNPEDILMVIHNGIIRLFDEEVFKQVYTKVNMNDYNRINVNGVYKYIYGNILKLMNSIKEYYPEVYLPITE